MLFNEAKRKLIQAGYRVVNEVRHDIYADIREILKEDGYNDNDITDLMMRYSNEIEDLIMVDKSAFEIAAAIEGYLEDNNDDYDEETEEISIVGDRWGEIEDFDESYIAEGKSRVKGDRFSHKEKVAFKNKKKGCCGKNCRWEDEDDDELDESYWSQNDGVDLNNAIENIFINDYGMSEEMVEKILDRYDELIYDEGTKGTDAEDIADMIATKMQVRKKAVSTDNSIDFNNNFRAKTILLKKALSPKFVSELIKRNDFEIDADDVKKYAIEIIEKANLDAKDPVQALQKKIKAHFPGV